MPRNIRSGKIIDSIASNCFDDGFNPGGDIATENGSPDDVLNIHIEGCLAEYIYNSGFHLSGGARNITGINNAVNRCGGFALDYVHE